MDFIAIDFETANYRADSACQIGISVVRDNRIIESQSLLIKPPYGGFIPFFTTIHGITPQDVEYEKTFDELWKTIKPYFSQNNLLIAHNAGFDANVLFNTLKTFEIAIPELTVACTLSMARKTWRKESSYGLKAIAERLGLQFLHHDAGEDARVCAEIAIRIFEQFGLGGTRLTADTVDYISETIGIEFGWIDEYGIGNCRSIPNKKKGKLY